MQAETLTKLFQSKLIPSLSLACAIAHTRHSYRADTCFMNLGLPRYSTYEVTRSKLLFAIMTDVDAMDADVGEPEEQSPFRGFGGGGGGGGWRR